MYCCKRNSQPRQDNDLMNYEQKSPSLDQKHEYQEKTTLILITRSMNKTWIQLVLTRVRNNVPRLFIYTLDIYSTLLVAQAIYKVVAWASSYWACIPSYLKLYLVVQGISKAVAWALSCLAWVPSHPKAVLCALRCRHRLATAS
jgi:hypothetical protein